jgi:hypothetical protein
MAESFLTTDIIVIVVLVVVLGQSTPVGIATMLHAVHLFCLVLVGLFAFLLHFYWTKIGVSEIWNTARWSSMRSSIYQTVRRFSGAPSSKVATERPLSGVSIYSDGQNNYSGSLYSQEKKPSSVITSYSTPSNVPYARPTPSNPVSSIAYQDPSRASYGTKIGQPMASTMIHNTHEYDQYYYDPSGGMQKQRF